eukprot:scaffold16780_cov63-Phaeocystis_antarctica.AAC.6
MRLREQQPGEARVQGRCGQPDEGEVGHAHAGSTAPARDEVGPRVAASHIGVGARAMVAVRQRQHPRPRQGHWLPAVCARRLEHAAAVARMVVVLDTEDTGDARVLHLQRAVRAPAGGQQGGVVCHGELI